MLKSGLQMAPEFLRLLVLEKIRSFSFGRDLIAALVTLLVVAFILFYLVGVALFMGSFIETILEVEDVTGFLNAAAIYYLLAEFLMRFFLQKRPLFDLARYLHLPVKRSGIIRYLLGKSLITTFSIAALILFLPVTITEIAAVYGPLAGLSWIGTLIFLSLTLHWFVMWLNETTTRSAFGIVAVLILTSIPFAAFYYNLFNIGDVTAPFFALSTSSPIPVIGALAACFAMYRVTLRQYTQNSYLDRPQSERPAFFQGTQSGLFSNFGIPGAIADSELKLILRHKKSRSYLAMSFLFLLYGLLLYEFPDAGESFTVTGLDLFAAIFMTGIFFVQYGQFFLSWNSSFFDFYMARNMGLGDLLRGKVLMLSMTIILAYVLTLPYLYYGWEILLVHTAALFFNMGLGIHIIILMSLWEPKPMDINKGGVFNYEGIGIAQFVMIIPYFLTPYLIYLPVAYVSNTYAALLAVSVAGIAGLLFRNQLINLSASILERNRHKISSSFRRGT